MISLKQRVKKALNQLKGKDLGSYGLRAKSELEFMKENKTADEKALRFIEEVINEHYS